MILLPGDSVFSDLPDRFVSPFPSSDSRASPKWAAMAAGNPGRVAADQTKAWSATMRLSMMKVAVSPLVGGFRTQWLKELITEQEGYGGEPVFGGLFAEVQVPDSTNWEVLAKGLFGDSKNPGANVAGEMFGAAVDFIASNAGVYGQILKAGVDISKFFFRLAMAEDSPITLITVPWQEYSRDTDEDLINTFLTPMMGTADWTPLFMPTMASHSFRLAETLEGENTRSFGAFKPGNPGEPLYTTGGTGFMPGTQQMAEVMQMAAMGSGSSTNDIITNVGTFYPAVSQLATAAENLVNRNGSADMFKIKASHLEVVWLKYFDAYFGEGFDQLARLNRGKTDYDADSARLCAKALWQFIVGTAPNQYQNLPGISEEWRRTERYLNRFTQPGLFVQGKHQDFFPEQRYSSVAEEFIAPALQDLRKRQMSALAHSLVCAYVRYERVGSLPPFAAFADEGPVDKSLPHANDSGVKNWGQQLAARCKAMRTRFLTHLDRYKVRNIDAIQVDPVFGALLKSTKRLAPEFPLRGNAPFDPLDPDAPDAPPSKGPGGGATQAYLVGKPDQPTGPPAVSMSTEAQVAVGTLAVAGAVGGLGLHLATR